MSFDEVVTTLGLGAVRDKLATGWEESAATWSGEVPDFLKPSALREWREYAGLGAEYDEPMARTAQAIASNPALLRLMWHGYHLAYLRESPTLYSFQGWPEKLAALGKDSGFFYLILILAGTPLIAARHGAMGVDESVTRAAASEARGRCERCQVGHKELVGVLPREVSWMGHHVAGRVFTLGRFQFMFGGFRGPVEFFRHKTSGRVAALAVAGTRFNDRGLIDVNPSTGAVGWVAERRDTAASFVGHEVLPVGHAVREVKELPRTEWRHVLAPNDSILEIHIPPGGGLTPEACRKSLELGVKFFRERFPDRPFEGLTCESWLSSPHVEEMLPADSNLVRFIRESFLYPIPSDPSWGWMFLFGHGKFDPATAPRDTSLRRAALDYMERGGVWRSGGMAFFAEDLPRYGEQVYRTAS